MNSLSFTQIQYKFVFCCLYSLSISRIYHEFTIYFAIHYRSSFFFANSLWNYFKFSFDTYSLLIHFLFGVITIDTLFFREFTFCTSLFELTFFFREFTKNTPSASVIQDVFAIFFAKILWEHYPLHENTIRALSFIAKILWEHYAGVQLLIHHNFSSKKMITWINLFQDPLLIQFELMKVDQNWVFEQFINHVTMNCSKTHFWSTFISSNWIKSEFLITLKADQKWVFKQIESRDH